MNIFNSVLVSSYKCNGWTIKFNLGKVNISGILSISNKMAELWSTTRVDCNLEEGMDIHFNNNNAYIRYSKDWKYTDLVNGDIQATCESMNRDLYDTRRILAELMKDAMVNNFLTEYELKYGL